MAEDSAALAEPESAPTIDIEAASDKIGADLFPETIEKETAPSPQEKVAEALAEPHDNGTPTKTIPPLPTVWPAPKSWTKDVHPVWESIPAPAQEYLEKREKDYIDGLRQYTGAAQYGESIYKVLAPYEPLLKSKGLDAPAVITDLMGTYTRLTQGTVEQRQTALLTVAKNLGIPLPGGPSDGTTPPNPLDPRIQTIEQQLQEMRDAQTAQQRVALQAAQTKAATEVEAFVSETEKDGSPKHPYFDEVFKELVAKINEGYSLQEAYERAVWDNPVTREKQKQAWFQTETEKAKERARLDALPKQKARSVNVKSQDTRHAPTELLGSMDDTLRATFRDIKERTTH